MYLDRSSATKRLKRTTTEHNLLLVRLHCLWNAQRHSNSKLSLKDTRNDTAMNISLHFLQQEHFYPSNVERGTFKVLHVSYHLGKKNKQQEMSTTAVCSSWKAEETVFSTRLLQTFSLGFFSFTWSYIRTKAFSNSRKDDLEQWK